MCKFTPLLLLILMFNGCHPQNLDKEENPILEAAKSFLEEAVEKNPDITKNAGMVALSGILQTIKNPDGNTIGDLLSHLNMPSSNNVASDILTGIAAILDENSQGFDPKIIGQVAEVFSNLVNKGEADVESNKIPEKNVGPNWGSVLSLASNLISSMVDKNNNVEGEGLEGLLNLLPMLTNSAPSGHVHFADSNLEDQSEHERSEKSNYVPPFMRVIYQFWDYTKKSEFGEMIWRKSGLESIFHVFVDEDGYFQVDRIFESMENTVFRRRWIKSLSSFVAEWVKHLSDPTTQARYSTNLKYIGNSFLKSQGYSKSIYFDPARPTDSLIVITDAVLKRHFGLKVNSGKYIKPAVSYIQELFKLGGNKNWLDMSHLSSRDISSKLSELLNGELIEPILRVWKAYKFSIQHPQCDKRLICFLNRKSDTPVTKSGLKPGVIKLSSLIASWYLSGRTGTPFWKLYNAATEDHNCEIQYPAECQQFFHDDIKFTTESIHNEEL